MSVNIVDFNNDERAFLYRLARNLLQDRDYGELLSELLDITIQGVGADRGCVVIREKDQFRVSVSRNIRQNALAEMEHEISTTIARTVVTQGKVVVIDDAQADEQLRDKKSIRRLGLRSVMCAPLIVSQEAYALIYLENRDVSNSFSEQHRALLEEICSLSALRLRTAVVITEARRKATESGVLWNDSDGIITCDSEMARLLGSIDRIAPTDLSVLIQGETGTGKELIARAIYRRSHRSNGPFVVVNCASIPASLIESELFGWRRGAHSLAHQDRTGLIGSADRGTLFLDEIGDMPRELQPRLLRVLQSGEFNRLGSSHPDVVDVRVIAATNRDLEREVREGDFREDLYFRLATVPISVPPLRERPHDIHLLIDHFMRVFAGRAGRKVPVLRPDCLERLASYSFPGNVRELENEMAKLVALSLAGEEIQPSALSARFLNIEKGERVRAAEVPLMSLAEMEKKLVRAALTHTADNRTRAAQILGITREGLRIKMQRLGLNDESPPVENRSFDNPV